MDEKVKKRIISLYNRGYRVSPYREWRKDLFDIKNSHQEITNYIYDRFRKTTEPVEYYTSMIFLVNVIPDKELFIPYHESPQHRELISETIEQNKITKEDITEKNICIIDTIDQIRPIGD